MHLNLDSIKKILVLRYRSIGDILLANPALAGLRQKFPEARIDLLVDDLFQEIVFNNPNVDRVIINGRKLKNSWLKNDLKSIKEIRAQRYDLVVDLQAGPRGAITSLFSGAKIRAGHLFRLRNRLCYNLYAQTPAPDDHTWRVQFLTVKPLGIDWPEKPEFFLDIPEIAMVSMRRKLDESGLMFDRPLVVLHPGARVRIKRWPAAKMGQIARWLVDEKKCAVIFAGSEADLEEIRTARRASGYALPYFVDISLSELGAMLKLSQLIICNDSGPMHMAGALNVPTIALFGPSDPLLWSPVGKPMITLTCPPMECMPCDQKQCVRPEDHCMSQIELEDVKLAVNRLNVLA